MAVLGCSFGAKQTETPPEKKVVENNSEPVKPNSSSAAASPVTADIAGSYKVNGTGINGNNYNGNLAVTKRDEVYQFSWEVGQEKYEGIGVQSGNAVAAAYTIGTDGKGCGAVIYKINPDDSIEGKWGTWGVNQSGAEKAVPNGKTADSTGTFDVDGTNPNQSSYKGKLDIERSSADVYQFSWDVGTKYVGTGIKVGEYLAAGSGSKQCGFVIYEVRDGKLSGKWGVPGATELGTELAVKP